ncbi:MAG TPA: hypothetical protein VNJ71_06270 [Gemmatimonadales bacterium]|nr:hypothetical protein [Gemmatimonadales bacterium]
MLPLLQAAVPGWVGPMVAISLAIIALSFVAIAAAALAATRRAAVELEQLHRVVEGLRQDLSPAVTAVSAISNDGRRLVTVLSDEAEQLARASRRLREALRDRLANLDAVYEVLEGEIEETALDVATTLRTFRTGHGWYARLRRLLGGRRRR